MYSTKNDIETGWEWGMVHTLFQIPHALFEKTAKTYLD